MDKIYAVAVGGCAFGIYLIHALIRDILHRIQSYTTVGGSNRRALCYIDISLFIDNADCASCQELLGYLNLV